MPTSRRSTSATRAIRRIGVTLTLGGFLVLAADGAASAAAAFDTSDVSSLSRGLAWYALGMCIVGIFISSAMWAMGSKGSNPGQELTGKKGILVCLMAAFFIGALPGMINWLSGQADKLDSTGTNQPSTGGQVEPCPGGQDPLTLQCTAP